MARKRSIKPEFFKDTDLSEVCIEARYLYAGMWPYMDRQGVIEADARIHRTNIFPHDEKITVLKVLSWIDELVKHGFVKRFSWKGKTLLFCPTFSRHQKLYPDEKANFEVSDELLLSLSNDALLPAGTESEHRLETQGTVSDEVKVKEKVEVKGISEKSNLKIWFQKAFDQFPIRVKGPNAEQRFQDQIQTESDFNDHMASLTHYRLMLALPENSWRQPKQSYAAYLGTKASGFFWRDFIDPRSAAPSTQKNQKQGTGPRPIVYAPAEKVLAEQNEEDARNPEIAEESIRKLRSITGQIGNFPNNKKEGA